MPQPSPYAVVAAAHPVRTTTKRALLTLTRELEREALAGPPGRVAAVLQDARFLTEVTRSVYAGLAAAGCPGTLYARGLVSWLAPGVRGVDLDEDDPLVDEWVLVLPSADRPAVLAATDLHAPHEHDLTRAFSYAVSREPAVVQECARLLLP